MEVTKWLKPSESASRIGDRARVCRPKSALNRDGLNVSVGSDSDVCTRPRTESHCDLLLRLVS
jgi:hypothetical protein